MSTYHAIVRAAYEVDRDEESWTAGIARAAAACVGADAGTYIVEPARPDVLRAYSCVGETFSRWAQRAHESHVNLPTDIVALLYQEGPFASLWSEKSVGVRARDLPEVKLFVDEAAQQMAAGHDVVGIYGGSSHGGVMLCLPLTKPGLSPRTRWALKRVAVHLDAAYRLRRGGGPTEALVDESGRILDGSLDVDERVVAEAANNIAASARYAESAPSRALSVWEGLVAGRWSLVRAREQSGRRVLLLRRNELDEAQGEDPVARRISSVAALVARGHANKLIAYELGIPISTVASDLKIALARLGLARRSDLARLSVNERDDSASS